MDYWQIIENKISSHTHQNFRITYKQAIGGGCINTAYKISNSKHCYFIKLNQADQLAMFEAEYQGLLAIANSQTIKVPKAICTGIAGSYAYIVMQYLELSASRKQEGSELLGQQLAQMHQTLQSQFGWQQDNTIGSTPQINTLTENWIDFWQHYRLGYQLKLAQKNGADSHTMKLANKLLANLKQFFSDYQASASLLHGDLWGGNYAYDHTGQPVIFDPAVYFGDRETDIAMTELFGGFSPKFYHAYNDVWPLDSGYQSRKTLYNLYHILNHFNLFGAGYLSQAKTMIQKLLSEL